jgi:hypothetical protein
MVDPWNAGRGSCNYRVRMSSSNWRLCLPANMANKRSNLIPRTTVSRQRVEGFCSRLVVGFRWRGLEKQKQLGDRDPELAAQPCRRDVEKIDFS